MSESDAPHLLQAVEYARILRAAGDPAGAARLLDSAFEAEGQHSAPVRDRLRFRALLLRADLAMHMNDDDALRGVAEAFAGLDDDG